MTLYKKLLDLFKKPKPERSSAKIIRLDTTESTNRYLRDYVPEMGEEITVVVADYQTNGKGQGRNSWESEKGKNLLFSILLHPKEVPVAKQFLLSEYGALSLKEVLSGYIDEGISLKWPNDIYWNDKKLSGTLIETKIGGGRIKDCIFGIGLNVNQTEFRSDAPNPVSMAQIVGREIDRDALLDKIVRAFERNYELIRSGNYIGLTAQYHESLYRSKGFFPYIDSEGGFEGSIVEVEDDGHLILRDSSGRIRSYEFKEIKYGKI